MIDFSLTEEQKMLRDLGHRFAEEVIRPTAVEFDRISDPSESYPWEVIKKAFKLGFHKLTIPEKYGGMGMGMIDSAILLEELAWGDVGVALALSSNIRFGTTFKGNEEQKKKWFGILVETDVPFLISNPCTEPTGGTEIVYPLDDPALGVKTTAVRDGNDWVINGEKCFITNAGVASLNIVLARTDKTKPNIESLSTFLVPSDTPGLKFGKIEDKMGHRLSRNGDIILEDVRVPEQNRIPMKAEPGVGGAAGLFPRGIMAIGLARAAYEYALKYSGERVSWGRLIREYPAVSDRLFDMKMKIEASRVLVWKLMWAAEHPEEAEGLDKLGNMAKVFPTSLVEGIVTDAVRILGAYGYMKDLPLEKYVRDSVLFPIVHWTNEVHRFFGAQNLYL